MGHPVYGQSKQLHTRKRGHARKAQHGSWLRLPPVVLLHPSLLPPIPDIIKTGTPKDAPARAVLSLEPSFAPRTCGRGKARTPPSLLARLGVNPAADELEEASPTWPANFREPRQAELRRMRDRRSSQNSPSTHSDE